MEDGSMMNAPAAAQANRSAPLLLSLLETRVLGVLVEKQHTVPDTYPLTLNALVGGRGISPRNGLAARWRPCGRTAATPRHARDALGATLGGAAHHRYVPRKRAGVAGSRRRVGR